MQISSINFGSTYRIAGKNRRKVYYSNYKPAKAKTANPQKGLLTAGISLGTTLLVLLNPLAANKEASSANTHDFYIPVNPIIEEGEMPSSKYFDDNYFTPSLIEDSSSAENISSTTESQETTILTEETSEATEETQASERNFEINLSEEQKMSLDEFVSNWHENMGRYMNMQEETGVPAELIAAIHWRESGGDFNTYLHNGARLGQTIDTYFGERWFNNWEDAAMDALNSATKVNFDSENPETYYRFAEMYNGTGYSDYFNMNSPYVWAGTDRYTCGKYVADGVFDPDVVDRQVGVAVLLDAIMS